MHTERRIRLARWALLGVDIGLQILLDSTKVSRNVTAAATMNVDLNIQNRAVYHSAIANLG